MTAAATGKPRGLIGVVMVTYNGARHIRAQLESILRQSPAPDDVLIMDDGSTDRTLDIVADVTRASAVQVRVVEGSHVGLRRNVQRAMESVQTEVVVLADQDDVWLPGRLAAIDAAFADPDVTLWFSDAALIGDDSAPLEGTTWSNVRLDGQALASLRNRRAVSRLIHGQTVTGATMAIRRSVLRLALPFPDELEPPDHLMLHDGWLAVLAALQGAVVADPHVYTQYRQHAAQVTGMSMSRTEAVSRAPNERRTDQARVALVLSRVRSRDALTSCDAGEVGWLLAAETFHSVRALPRSWRKVAAVLREGRKGSYRAHAAGWRTLVRDLVLPPAT